MTGGVGGIYVSCPPRRPTVGEVVEKLLAGTISVDVACRCGPCHEALTTALARCTADPTKTELAEAIRVRLQELWPDKPRLQVCTRCGSDNLQTAIHCSRCGGDAFIPKGMPALEQ